MTLRVLSAARKKEIEEELTRPPDPVWGLEDVARGRDTLSPRTIYAVRNADRSGVMGILQPSGEYVNRTPTTTGQRFVTKDDDGVTWDVEIAWDGAQPSPVSATPIGFWDGEETKPIFQGHSKGLLLGDYPNNGELWAAIGVGRAMV